MRITRIVCGIEPVGRGVLAAGQAARLAPEDAPVVLVGAADVAAVGLSQPIGGDIDMGPMPVGPYTSLDELESAVRAELERAAATLGGRRGVATRIEVGGLAEALDQVSAEEDGSLLALDAPQEGRMFGIIDGEPATWLLHESARPLLLARGSQDDRAFPRSVAVGVDGSAPAAAAAEAAGEIAQRCGAGLRLVVARGGRGGGAGALDELRARLPPHELVEDPKSAVHALSEVDADLVVVGSRGLHGLRALGSVSERVAHGSHASVLVVR
jgi:nucleotide-binding universal stress UspA family protein